MVARTRLHLAGIATRVQLTALAALSATLGHAVPGIDSRPPNLTCVAPPRPGSGASSVSLEPAFPGISVGDMMTVEYPPGNAAFLYVLGRDGRIYRFANNPAATQKPVVLDLRSLFSGTSQEGQTGLMDMVFHPDFSSNGELFVSYSVPGVGDSPHVSYVARYRSTDGGASFSSSGEVLLSLVQNGVYHGVSGLMFGQDGYLYIGFGDSGRPRFAPDPFRFNGKILRIDVDSGSPYAVPAGNPFVGGGGAPEVYALGFRNPWRFSQDSVTGELWVGDVGEDNWEEVDRVVSGGHYGWNIREGAHCREDGCDTSGLIDPIYEYSHAQGCAVTGGFVYRGAALPGLIGKFIFSDVCTGEFSSLQANGAVAVDSLLISGLAVRNFSEAPDGELYVIAGGESRILQLVADGAGAGADFPALLSETGCVNPSDPRQVANGVIPFTVNTALWSDGADKRRWLAIPDGTQIAVQLDGDWELPIGTVLIKEFSSDGVPFETRLMVRHDDGGWAGYTYEWNASLTDANLVASAGLAKLIGGQLDWTYPSRAQCLECHSAAAGRALGPETAQLNGLLIYPSGIESNQLETLESIDLFSNSLGGTPASLPSLAPVDDLGRSVEERARSYLHANCSICHRPDGPGQGPMDVRFQVEFAVAGMCDAEPDHGDLGVTGAKILFPGDPARSVLSLRMHAQGAGRMPPLATRLVDGQGTAVVDAWIAGLAACSAMADTTPPGAPGNLEGVAVSGNRVDLTWDAATDDVGVVEYLVRRDGGLLGAVGATAFSDSGLEPETLYRYAVVARDAAGNVSAAASVEVATLPANDTEPPSIPTGIQAVAMSASRIDLTWGAATDNGALAGYSVYRDGTLIGTTSGTSFSDTGLAAATMYRYAITATDTSGNESSPSAETEATTQESAAPPPSPRPSSGGGGGSTEWLSVLALLIVLRLRGRSRSAASPA